MQFINWFRNFRPRFSANIAQIDDTNEHKFCNLQSLKILQVAGGYISHYLLGSFNKYLFRKSRKELEKKLGFYPWS